MWARTSIEASICKKKLGFQAIGVVAAIDTEGRLVAYVTCNQMIRIEQLRDLSNQIVRKYKHRPVNIFMDNLRLHYTAAFNLIVSRNRQQILFNASCSSQLNPIERLWALAKRSFGRLIIGESDLSSQEQIRALV